MKKTHHKKIPDVECITHYYYESGDKVIIVEKYRGNKLIKVDWLEFDNCQIAKDYFEIDLTQQQILIQWIERIVKSI